MSVRLYALCNLYPESSAVNTHTYYVVTWMSTPVMLDKYTSLGYVLCGFRNAISTVNYEAWNLMEIMFTYVCMYISTSSEVNEHWARSVSNTSVAFPCPIPSRLATMTTVLMLQPFRRIIILLALYAGPLLTKLSRQVKPVADPMQGKDSANFCTLEGLQI